MMKKGGSRLDTEGRAVKGGASGGERRADGSKLAGLWRGSRAFRVCAVVLGVLVVLTSAGFITWNALVRLPDADTDSGPVFDDGQMGNWQPDDGPDVAPSGSAPPSSAPKPTPSPMKLRDDVYTILMAGTFDDGNTDTIMVGTMDLKQGKLDVISIPRDTTTQRGGKLVKINSIFSAAGGGDAGMQALQEEISTLMGFKPNSYAMMRMSGFKKLVNTVGGVEFTIPFNMIHLDKDDSKSIRLYKGTRTLNGDEALQLMRFRVSDPGSGGGSYDDYGRMKTQQQVIMAVFKKMIRLNNWTKITEYVKIASESIKPTNLDAGNMLGFAGELLKLDTEKITFSTLPTKTSGKSYYENVLTEDALKMINETVNPYTTPITADYVHWPQHE